jgi:hypothetical protein
MIAVGDRIQGWLDGVPYTATVAEILPQHPGCGRHRHIIVDRDDGTRRETTTDAVIPAT